MFLWEIKGVRVTFVHTSSEVCVIFPFYYYYLIFYTSFQINTNCKLRRNCILFSLLLWILSICFLLTWKLGWNISSIWWVWQLSYNHETKHIGFNGSFIKLVCQKELIINCPSLPCVFLVICLVLRVSLTRILNQWTIKPFHYSYLVICACEFVTQQHLSKLQHDSVVVNLESWCIVHCGPCLFP